MSAFTEPCAQVREALANALFGSGTNPADVDAALARVERLATDMETALQEIEELPMSGFTSMRDFTNAIREKARAVLSAREEGADTR